MMPSAIEIFLAASSRAFGHRLVDNGQRSVVAAAIVNAALAPDWRWCGGDWEAFYFEDATGRRVLLKQAAAKQSWEGQAAPSPRFAIDPRFDIHLFAWHPLSDDRTDHREPAQWQFFVVRTAALPEQGGIGLGPLERLAPPTTFAGLRDAVSRQYMSARA